MLAIVFELKPEIDYPVFSNPDPKAGLWINNSEEALAQSLCDKVEMSIKNQKNLENLNKSLYICSPIKRILEKWQKKVTEFR